MPELRAYDHEDFPPELHWQAISFMRMEWPAIDGGLLTSTYPASCHPVHFALTEGPILLSYAATLSFDIEHEHVAYRMTGLGNVLTYPGFRRLGYGGAVVRAATEAIDRSNTDVAGLFCVPNLVPFYAACGWRPITTARTLTGDASTPRIVDDVRMMRFLSAKGRGDSARFETLDLYLADLW